MQAKRPVAPNYDGLGLDALSPTSAAGRGTLPRPNFSPASAIFFSKAEGIAVRQQGGTGSGGPGPELRRPRPRRPIGVGLGVRRPASPPRAPAPAGGGATSRWNSSAAYRLAASSPALGAARVGDRRRSRGRRPPSAAPCARPAGRSRPLSPATWRWRRWSSRAHRLAQPGVEEREGVGLVQQRQRLGAGHLADIVVLAGRRRDQGLVGHCALAIAYALSPREAEGFRLNPALTQRAAILLGQMASRLPDFARRPRARCWASARSSSAGELRRRLPRGRQNRPIPTARRRRPASTAWSRPALSTACRRAQAGP